MKDAALSRLFLRFRDKRNGRALAAVFDATARELIEVAGHLMRDVDEAEDLVQTTFRIAIERAQSFDRDRSLRAWLYGILAREAAKSRRRAARRIDASALGDRATAEPIDELVSGEVSAVLCEAIDRLPAPYREVVQPIVCGGRSSRDVARELDRAPGTVRVQFQRGLEKLRRLLPKEYGSAGLAFALPSRGIEALREAMWRDAGHGASAPPTALAVAAHSATAVLSVSPAAWVLAAAALFVGVRWMALPEAPEPAHEEPIANARSVRQADDGPTPVGDAQPARGGIPGQDRVPVPPPSEHPPRAQVVGDVVDEADRPVPGVIVEGVQAPDDRNSVRFLTDNDGRFSFAGLTPGWWFFRVDDPRYAVVWWRKFGIDVPTTGADPAHLQLRLYAPREVAGVVVDESGQVVEGARITLAVERVEGEERPVQGHLVNAVQVATSDREGHFRFGRLSPGGMSVILDHPDYARTLADFNTADAAVRLVLEKGLTLEGRVLDESRPLVGVVVTATATCRAALSMGDRSATTGADGRFRLERIHSFGNDVVHGVPTVSVALDDEDWVSSSYRIHEWTEGSLPEVTIAALPVGSAVVPRSVDVGRDLAREAEANGEPFGTATLRVHFARVVELDEDHSTTVWIRGISPGLENFYRSDRAAGARGVDFPALAAGCYRVWTLNRSVPNFRPVEVEVTHGEVAEVVLRPGTITLRGRLRCGAEPVSDVQVHCTGTMRGRGFVRSDGSYEVPGLVPGTYEVSVWAGSDFENHYDVVVRDDGSGVALFDIPLPTGIVTGLVRGIEFRRDDRSVRVFPRGWGTASGNRGGRAEVDDEGRFRMRFVPPGEYKVFVWELGPAGSTGGRARR